MFKILHSDRAAVEKLMLTPIVLQCASVGRPYGVVFQYTLIVGVAYTCGSRLIEKTLAAVQFLFVGT